MQRLPIPGGWRLLGGRDYRRIWLAHTGSVTGDSLHSVAMIWLVFETLGGGPEALAALAIANLLPSLLLGILSGTIVDRLDRRRVMVLADIARALLVGILALMVWSGFSGIPIVIVIGMLTTVASTFFSPARNAVMPAYVERDDLVRASALIQTSSQAAQLIGPAAGGVLFLTLGPVGLLLLDAASFFWSAILIQGLTPGPALPIRGTRRPLLQEATDGLHFIAGHPPSRLVILIAAGNQLFASGPFRVMVPAWLTTVLGGGPAEFGTLMSALAAGLLSTNLIVSAIKTRLPLVTMIVVGVFLDGLLFVLFAYTPTLLLAAATFFAMGAANAVLNAANVARLQLTVPAEMRGRTFATFGTVMNLTAPISLAVTGSLASSAGPVPLITASGAGLMAVGLLGMVSGLRSHLREPKQVGPSA